MKGSVRRRGAGWEYLYREVDPVTGKSGRLRSKAGFRTEKDAQRALREVLSAMDKGEYVSPSRLTVREFAENRWLPAIAATVRPSTLHSYGRNLRLHVLPTLGDVLLQRLDPSALNTLYAQLLTDGRRDQKAGKPLSAKSVRYVHDVVNRILRDALRWRLVTHNVATLADPPKLRVAGRPEFRTWTSKELNAFLVSVADHRLYAAWLLLATTGMRRGEVLGLRWTDVDFGSTTVSVRRSLVCVKHEAEYSETKTVKSRRAVALDPATLAALRTHRAAQAAEKLAAGETYDDRGLVFCTPLGRELHPERFSRAFLRRSKSAGLPRIRLHDLRHTWATLALQAGIHPKVVSERLGHANVSITLDIYSHVAPSMHAEAAAKVAGLILG